MLDFCLKDDSDSVCKLSPGGDSMHSYPTHYHVDFSYKAIDKESLSLKFHLYMPWQVLACLKPRYREYPSFQTVDSACFKCPKIQCSSDTDLAGPRQGH